MPHLATLWRAARSAAGRLAFAAVVATPVAASAQSFDFQGLFSRDDQRQYFRFQVVTPGTVTLRSYGYAGGTTPGGLVVGRGGFDTILSLFSAGGGFIADNDDGVGVAVDPTTGAAFDARLVLTLGAGTYFAAVTQADNYAAGNSLSNGFERDGQGNFTNRSDFDFTAPCPSGGFRDLSGSAGRCRTGSYAISFSGNVAAAEVVPEPAILVLLAPALVAVAFVRRARRS